MVAGFRKSLISAGYDKIQPSEYNSIIPSNVCVMRSFFYECLRKHINGTAFREVLAPTKLVTNEGTWHLEKGAMVTMAVSLLHENPSIHPNPEQFRPKRFLATEVGGEGENPTKGLKAFGGGASYCPGRLIAEKQIIGFLAACCMRYDMRIVSEKWEIPKSADFEKVVEHPPIHIEIRRRVNI